MIFGDYQGTKEGTVKTARFYGASDDLFEVEGAFRDEMGCYDTFGVYQVDLPDNG